MISGEDIVNIACYYGQCTLWVYSVVSSSMRYAMNALGYWVSPNRFKIYIRNSLMVFILNVGQLSLLKRIKCMTGLKMLNYLQSLSTDDLNKDVYIYDTKAGDYRAIVSGLLLNDELGDDGVLIACYGDLDQDPDPEL